MTNPDHDILCIGSVLWDVIGRSPGHMRPGNDVPGRISRIPGGVAMNVAMTLVRLGLRPALLSAVGRDAEGAALIDRARLMGIETSLIHRSDDLPTDSYMAIEGAGGLVAAIADAHSLEAAGDKILSPLHDGRIGRPDAPYRGLAVLDGNLSESLLAEIATGDLLGSADLRVAPASPGKALRLLPLMRHPRVTLYVNLEEAGLLLGRPAECARDAAVALRDRGAARVLVTDGGNDAAMALDGDTISAAPPSVLVRRVTGAGDTFMAAHIAAELRGAMPGSALRDALDAAAAFVAGDIAS